MGLRAATVIDYPGLGPVELRPLATAVRFTARRRADRYTLTVPARATAADITDALRRMSPRLAALPRPAIHTYPAGYAFSAPGWAATVAADPAVAAGKLRMRRATSDTDGSLLYTIAVSPETLATPAAAPAIAKALCAAAHAYTAAALIPDARAIAAGLGARPSGWSVSRGAGRLGFCTAAGRIALSERVAMLPVELRRYIITHELAHLTHFDHSPDFHTLWRRYLGCDPAGLRPILRKFKWPV